jgi:site-specific DNA-methyltransferase (adenine-specific)
MNLLNGDCLEQLKTLEANSVDMVLADLPYGTTACKWDNVIPFEPLWAELHRVCKPNAAMCMFGSEPFSSAMRLSNPKAFKYDWYWNKKSTSGFMNAKLKPMNTVEIISVFSDGKTSNGNANNMRYFPQGLIEVNKLSKSGNSPHKENSPFRANSTPSNTGGYIQRFTGYPRNLIEHGYEKKSVHPTQKPVALLEYLIKTYTLEGDTVLDPTMGSGSTGVACVNTNRKFIGIEREPDYMAIAEKRIFNSFPEFKKQISE